jgi:hypothetical protein
MDSERNRPRGLQNASGSENPDYHTNQRQLRQLVEAGLPPSEVDGAVFDAIRNERFYILTHADWKPLVFKRTDADGPPSTSPANQRSSGLGAIVPCPSTVQL